jgi:hypothetical protein
MCLKYEAEAVVNGAAIWRDEVEVELSKLNFFERHTRKNPYVAVFLIIKHQTARPGVPLDSICLRLVRAQRQKCMESDPRD